MNDLISRAEAIAVMKEECWKDREMKLSDRIERRLLALPTASQPEAEPVADDWLDMPAVGREFAATPAPVVPAEGPISTLEMVYRNMPDIPELPEACQPRNIARSLAALRSAPPQETPMTAPDTLTEAQFVERFVAHCLNTCGFTHFDDGEPVEEYARMIAPSYWADTGQREDGPEVCAEADMDYWGEE